MKQGFTPVSQGDSHGPLGLALPNNILVQRRHNVPRLHVGRGRDLLEVDAAGVLDGIWTEMDDLAHDALTCRRDTNVDKWRHNGCCCNFTRTCVRLENVRAGLDKRHVFTRWCSLKRKRLTAHRCAEEEHTRGRQRGPGGRQPG